MISDARLKPRATALALALVFLALHLPYLPASLEDLDSINFALGVGHFDVAHHQPHPPGYPVFIAVAKVVHGVVPSEATALAVVSVAAGALGVLAIAALFRRLERDAPWSWPLTATALAITSPLYWFTAVRPLSDMAGLAAALGVQVLTLSASSTPALAVAAFAAGVATGFRSQVAWLTVPLLLAKGLAVGDWGLGAGGSGLGTDETTRSAALQGCTPATGRPEGLRYVQIPNPKSQITTALAAALAFTAGALAWAVPLVAISGGPSAYWHALVDQGAEDLGNIQMLWTRHDARTLVDALYYAFVAPWAAWPLAAIVLSLALVGAVLTLRRAPRALLWLALGFGPYLLFDLLFQETFTGRYALPLVIPMAYLAVAGARGLPRQSGIVLAIALAMFGAHAGGTSIAAYSRQPAPAFRLLADMRDAVRSTRGPPLLAMDRRESLDLRGPAKWLGAAMPSVARTLPAPPQHEWLEPARYWNGGGRAPVWFVVDPLRASIELVQHGEPSAYRWPLPYPVLVSGVRPNEMDWYRVERPDWYVGEGWALTPEAAGVADADRRGLQYGAIDAWIARETLGHVMLVGGRSFDPAVHPHIAVTIDGVVVDEWTIGPGSFARFVSLPAAGAGNAGDYSAVTIRATPPSRVAIEQFDASAARPLFAFGDGWQEPELNPRTGVRWRWLSERGELRRPSPASAVTLHLEGEAPRTYFSRSSHLIVRAGGRVTYDGLLSSDFSLDVPIASGEETIVLETDQVFSPADRSRRSADRRHLGLRMFKVEVRKTFQPAS